MPQNFEKVFHAKIPSALTESSSIRSADSATLSMKFARSVIFPLIDNFRKVCLGMQKKISAVRAFTEERKLNSCIPDVRCDARTAAALSTAFNNFDPEKCSPRSLLPREDSNAKIPRFLEMQQTALGHARATFFR